MFVEGFSEALKHLAHEAHIARTRNPDVVDIGSFTRAIPGLTSLTQLFAQTGDIDYLPELSNLVVPDMGEHGLIHLEGPSLSSESSVRTAHGPCDDSAGRNNTGTGKKVDELVIEVRHGQLGLAPRLTLALKSHRGKAGGGVHDDILMEIAIEGGEITGIAGSEQPGK